MLKSWRHVEKRIRNGIISVGVIAVIIIIVVLNPVLNNPPTEKSEGKARIIISLNYGKEIIFDKIIPSGKSALDSLKSVVNVTTSYGGKFVTGINGIKNDAQEKKDWFYYINGILANVGASDYILRDGDVMRWDYHYWGDNIFISAELEDFPEPFIHGYNGKTYPTIILYEKGYKDIAMLLYEKLKGKNVKIKESENVTDEEKKSDNLVVVGINDSLCQEINNMHENLGFFYYLDDGFVVDDNGTLYRGGFAEISQSPFNPKGTEACENALLFISGNHEYAKKCVEDMIGGNLKDFWCFEGEKI